MKFHLENTYGWCEKTWLGIGRTFNMHGELDSIFIELFIWRLELYFD